MGRKVENSEKESYKVKRVKISDGDSNVNTISKDLKNKIKREIRYSETDREDFKQRLRDIRSRDDKRSAEEICKDICDIFMDAPLIMHCEISDLAQYLLEDAEYKNFAQVQSKSQDYNDQRYQWELEDLGIPFNAKPEYRPKYCSPNFTKNKQGIKYLADKFGSDYLVLKPHINKYCTICPKTYTCKGNREYGFYKINEFYNVLLHMKDIDLQNLYKYTKGGLQFDPQRYFNVQIHKQHLTMKDFESVHISTKNKNDQEVQECLDLAKQLQRCYGIEVIKIDNTPQLWSNVQDWMKIDNIYHKKIWKPLRTKRMQDKYNNEKAKILKSGKSYITYLREEVIQFRQSSWVLQKNPYPYNFYHLDQYVFWINNGYHITTQKALEIIWDLSQFENAYNIEVYENSLGNQSCPQIKHYQVFVQWKKC